MASNATPLLETSVFERSSPTLEIDSENPGTPGPQPEVVVAGAPPADGGGSEGEVELNPGPFCTAETRVEHVHMVKCYADFHPAKYHMYIRFLSVVALFYAMPSFQFVWASYRFFGRTTHDDTDHPDDDSRVCRYNAKCYSEWKFYLFTGTKVTIPAFNMIISNIGYVFFGVVFMLIVRQTKTRPNHGLPEPKGMYYALGYSLILEGFFSGLYHVCPSSNNFQFDTTYMIIGSVFLLSILYAKRHARVGFSAYSIMFAVGGLVLTNLVSVLSYKAIGRWFWTLPIVTFGLVTYIAVRRLVSRDILDMFLCQRWPSQVKKKTRALLGVFVLVNVWISIIVATVIEANFFNTCLGLILCNSIIYLTYIIIHKIVKNESVKPVVWIYFTVGLLMFFVAVYYYSQPTYSSGVSIDESNKMNRPCVFWIWDKHDIWHFTGAVGIFCLMMTVFTMDHDLVDVPNENIYVF